MLIKSDVYTNRIKTKSGVVDIPPGTPFECEDAKAAAKIAAGRAERVVEGSTETAAPLEVSGGEGATGATNPPAGSNQGTDPNAGSGSVLSGEDLEALQAAILDIDPDDETLFMEDGRPTVKALSEAMEKPVSAAVRDTAWAVLQKVID